MSTPGPSEDSTASPGTHIITSLLHDLAHGDRHALQRLMPLIYEELRRVAQRQLRNERDAHTLSPTALVHEVYLWLAGRERVTWNDRIHFFAVAAVAMRRILVDYARRHMAAKRGGGGEHVPLHEAEVVADQRAETLIALDAALDELAQLDDRLSRVVEYRFFGGMTEDEVAAVLGLTARTVRRDWVKARGWLRTDLTKRGVIAELEPPDVREAYA